MGATKNIVIIGAGYGGILTAKKLANKSKKMSQPVTITLIDKNSYHTMLTELHEVSANRVPEDAIKISLKKIFAGRPVNVVLDEVVEVDFTKREVVSKNNRFSYDYLVLGTGSKPTYFGVKGAEENSFKLWSYEDAVLLKEHIRECFRKASATTNVELRRELLTFIVVGCGFTGVEMIGELAEYRSRICQEFEIDESEVRLVAVDQLPKILPIFPDNLIEKAENRLKKMGVEVMTCTPISEIDSQYAIVGEGVKIPSRTTIWAAGVESSDLMASVDIEKAGRNRAVTNQYLHLTSDDKVFVVGDNIFFTPEGEEKPVPQMVENAEHSSATVANNIVASLEGRAMKAYKPQFHGAMVCIGGRYGVAHLGMPGKFFGLTGFFAMFVKHFINVIYFLQVAGFNKIWTYMMHEFFHVKDNRSFVGGHFAKASPNFWLVPLRLFIGFKWLLEGIEKLEKVLEDPGKIFLIPASPAWNAVSSATGAAATPAPVTEAVSSATGAAAAAAPAVTEAVSSATTAAASGGTEAAASVYGAALHVPDFIKTISDWSMNLLFYGDTTYTGLAHVFQTGMVCAEIIVGLCLIFGLFTALASIVSIGMGLMIYVSGMAPVEMLWYYVGGFALIGGSGSTFGLDYYVLPWLKKVWKKIAWVKKNYLYID